MTFPEAATLALRIEVAVQGHAFQSKLHYTHNGPTLMDIGNVGVSKVRRFFPKNRNSLQLKINALAVKRLIADPE